MSGSGDWPGDETAETRVMALPAQEREILAALAVVGHASLSRDELAELLRVDDVAPLVADLEARGLVRSDERRCSAVGRIGEEIRRTNEALSTGDRLMGYLSTLAQGGRLTPGRLGEDSAAILGLSEWAAEMQRSTQLLEMVKTVEASYEIAHRAEEWRELLLRGRGAAHALGDRQSEIWMLQRLATAAAMAGDSAGAQQYLREADELQRTSQHTQQATMTEQTHGRRWRRWKHLEDRAGDSRDRPGRADRRRRRLRDRERQRGKLRHDDDYENPRENRDPDADRSDDGVQHHHGDDDRNDGRHDRGHPVTGGP